MNKYMILQDCNGFEKVVLIPEFPQTWNVPMMQLVSVAPAEYTVADLSPSKRFLRTGLLREIGNSQYMLYKEF